MKIKRFLDIIFGLFLIILTLPILILSNIGVFLSSKGSTIFKQKRIGLNKKIFIIYKIRTMHINPNREIKEIDLDSPGLFTFGAFLRRSKIDEIPQLLNIVKGDMSFIGPRPCLLKTAENMPDWAFRRFSVRPGLSGLAQINGVQIFLGRKDGF